MAEIVNSQMDIACSSSKAVYVISLGEAPTGIISSDSLGPRDSTSIPLTENLAGDHLTKAVVIEGATWTSISSEQKSTCGPVSCKIDSIIQHISHQVGVLSS